MVTICLYLLLITLALLCNTTSFIIFNFKAELSSIYSRALKSTADATSEAKKKVALDLLDCLTCPKDPEDVNYNAEKDARRSNLLTSNDYNELKVELRTRGIKTSGDKVEMITRLLLHVIDPTIKFDEM
jgi:hypothetical protein